MRSSPPGPTPSGWPGCYGNLVELAALQQHVAGQLGRPAGRLLMVVKSAHVYETERAYLLGVLAGDGIS
jgi:thymidylate synthase